MLSHSRARSRNRFIPCLQALEDRCVPAVTASFSGTTMTLTGDAHDNNITINDNGASSGSNLTTVLDGVAVTPPQFINTIVIKTGAGKDNVTYNLRGQLLSDTRALSVDLGADRDSLFVNFSGNGLEHSFTPFVGLGPPSSFSLNVQGGSGNDTIGLDFGTGNVSDGSVLNVTVNGGGGDDTIAVNYRSILGQGAGINGTVNMDLEGGGGKDTLSALFEPGLGSHGFFGSGSGPARINGGAAKDTIDYRIRLPLVGSLSVFAAVDGGADGAACKHTGNISSSHCSPDFIVT
jgi:hypothetical protein